MQDASKYLIVLVGPTAIGKTSLSIQLAKLLNCAIISADSRQFFKELAIGTAKPSLEEQSGVKHHFIDTISITESYNVGQFEEDVIELLGSLFQTQDIALMVGGSGLYVDAVCYGIDDIPKDENIRQGLIKELEEKGIESLQEELKKRDPEHYRTMNIKNPQRLIRALEVCRLSGKSYSSFRKNSVKKRPFHILKMGLTAPREQIYGNINLRVDLMMEQGLLDEVKSVYPQRKLNALNTVGYKELFDYIDGKSDLEEATELIKKNTRNFAKRQMTWFRRDEKTRWFDISEKELVLPYLKDQIGRI